MYEGIVSKYLNGLRDRREKLADDLASGVPANWEEYKSMVGRCAQLKEDADKLERLIKEEARRQNGNSIHGDLSGSGGEPESP